MVVKVTAPNIQDKITTGSNAATLINDSKRAVNQVVDVVNDLPVFGDSASKGTGTAAGQVPLNSDLKRPAKYQLEFEGVSAAVAAVSANPANYPLNTGIKTLSYRTKVECEALAINYPDGGGAGYVVEGNDGKTNADGVWGAGDKQLRIINPSRLNARAFGAVLDGVTNDAVAISNAADYAYANKIRFIKVDYDCYINGDVANKANVIFIGNGRFVITGNSDARDIGIYRRQVIPESSRSATAFIDNIQQIKVSDTDDCTVVFLGDSLTTYSANVTSSSNTKSAYFERMIRDSNPETDFTFHNRSIGGKAAADMNSKPASVGAQYGWYTDHDRDWLEYVYDLSPDVVVIATGMNEDLTFNPQDIHDIKTKIEANTNAAIVFVADYLPTISPVGIRAGTSFAWFRAQEWRDRAAGFIRSYANSIGYPLIDLNRTFSMVRDGIDVLSQRYIKNDDAISLVSGKLSTAKRGACRAFTLKATLEAGCFSNSDPLSVGLDEGEEHYAWLRESGGFIKIELRGEVGGLLSSHVTDLPVPVSSNSYEITVTPTTIAIRDLTVGQAYAQYSVNCIKRGGLFTPLVKYWATNTGPIESISGLYTGVEVNVMPTILDYEMWGVVESGFEDSVNGGDGQVHPSSFGLEALHGAHYSAQNFRLVAREVVTELNGEATWNPESIAVGGIAKVNLPVQGARLGDFVLVSHTGANSGNGSNEIVISGWVSANNNVAVIIQNLSAGIRTIPTGTLRAKVLSNQ